MSLPAVETFERAGLLAWPGIEVDWDGAWVRRAANGYTKRANSIQCFDPADQGEAEVRLAQAVDWLTERNLPPVVRTTPLESPALTAALDAANWRRIDLSHLYAMPLTPQQPDPGGTILDLADPLFLSAQRDLQHYQPDQMHKLQSLLASMTVPACGIVVEREGNVVASGLMAIADGIVITGNVITDPARRRQGLAAAMMRTGLSWANAKGARFAALNVQADNAAAKALYASLGYTHQYDYSYRIPGGPA
ncbi:ribosomal protein S18 acetylase RimI-like enzyme [Devosia subaequoris]|uniref:Ribosomal protein S18 acetylase RimI-like enzyme n=1 Tax=Devosia subaequoris TaxID=395930 RepID=A0A7W6IMW9_9HYPH|nr:ribosomal protein S18 acetylase RimI-like enzyme [Devosia subaequoris]MCP1209696.1 GNAT family N-acetyltransferase [Devosia subaequoris]